MVTLPVTRAYIDMKRGFTLVELLVAITLFSMVMLIVVSSLLTMVDANRKGQAIASVMNNLNFALESMTRMARTGTDYKCESNYSDLPSGGDCINGDSHLRFTASDGRYVNFRLLNNSLDRCIDPVSPGAPICNVEDNWIPMVGSEVQISSQSTFRVVGSLPYGGGDNPEVQPRIIFTIRGDALVSGESTKFDIQSTVVQRTPDR